MEVLEKEIRAMKEELAVQRLEESRLKRRLSFAESNYNGLAQQREQSKLSEARDSEKQRFIGYSNALYKEIKNSLMKSGVNIQSLNAEVLQLKKNIRDLNDQVSGLKNQVAEQELIQTRLMRNVDTARSTFEILTRKGEETKISSAIKAATIQVSVPATPPEFPVRPRKRQNVMIAGVVGLLASIMLAFFLEFLEKNRKNLDRPA
jgi:tyrosine-protein kinase Etk/Wzc